MADELARVVIVRDLGGILGKDIPDYLVNGVISLDHEGIIYRIEDLLHLGLGIYRGEFPGRVFQSFITPLSAVFNDYSRLGMTK